MTAFPIIVRIAVTVSTLVTLLGPTLTATDAIDGPPAPANVEPSEPDERDSRHRANRRDRRTTPPQGSTGTAPATGDLERPDVVDHADRADRTERSGDHPIGALDPDADVDPDRLPPGLVLAPDGGFAAAGATTGAEGDPPGAGATVGETLTAAPSCQLQCIVSGTAYARGTGAELVVTTDTPALITLHVYGPTHTVVGSDPDQLTTSYTVHLDDLQEASEYYVVASARDAHGKTSYAAGTFRTLRRVAEVTFHLNWEVTQRPSFADRYHYHYRVDGTWRPTVGAGFWPYPSPPSALPTPVIVEDAPAELDVAAQVVVASSPFSTDAYCPDHQQPFGPHGSAPGLPSPFGSGDVAWQGHCYDLAWSTAIPSCLNGVLLDDRPAGATSWVHHQLTVTLGTSGCYSQPLGISVPLTIDVTYVP